MALGVDMDFAELVLLLKDKYNLTLECAIPCPNQTKMWTKEQIDRYNNIIDCADTVLAVWNGEEKGGTWQTINYANRKKKKIDIIYIG